MIEKYPLVDPSKFHDACGIGFIATRPGKEGEKNITSCFIITEKIIASRS